VAFGETEATGLVALLAVAVLAALIARAAVRSRRWARDATDKRAAVEDLEERARIGALRHRDFDKWFEADSARRRRVGLPPLDREAARARRFDPTFELDAPAPRSADLRRRRREVREAVERGVEPPADPPPE